ncbi:hypothetical protein GCM10022631_11330 [Deinococcus rubellus]|uniref:hypothetical protein n=1 Tax=Deinococcus rubellus TaxID=1889240 RepID=UPI0031E66784
MPEFSTFPAEARRPTLVTLPDKARAEAFFDELADFASARGYGMLEVKWVADPSRISRFEVGLLEMELARKP